jgi:hypothetical protein
MNSFIYKKHIITSRGVYYSADIGNMEIILESKGKKYSADIAFTGVGVVVHVIKELKVNGTIVQEYENYGQAFCHKNDKFNFETGVRLALSRAMNLDDTPAYLIIMKQLIALNNSLKGEEI